MISRSKMLVSKACEPGGRLADFVERDAKGRAIGIRDPLAAQKAFFERTDYTDAPQHAPKAAQLERAAAEHPATEGEPSDASMLEAARREKWAKAKLAEIKLAEAEGSLVESEKVIRGYSAQVTGIRNKLLGIPSRAKQQMPDLPLAAVTMLDALVREALTDVANEDEP